MLREYIMALLLVQDFQRRNLANVYSITKLKEIVESNLSIRDSSLEVEDLASNCESNALRIKDQRYSNSNQSIGIAALPQR